MFVSLLNWHNCCCWKKHSSQICPHLLFNKEKNRHRPYYPRGNSYPNPKVHQSFNIPWKLWFLINVMYWIFVAVLTISPASAWRVLATMPTKQRSMQKGDVSFKKAELYLWPMGLVMWGLVSWEISGGILVPPSCSKQSPIALMMKTVIVKARSIFLL